MADRQQPAGPISPLTLYECYWASGGASGTVHVHAPDAPTAIQTVRDHASMFGLPHENPQVGKAIPVAIIEQGLDLDDDWARTQLEDVDERIA